MVKVSDIREGQVGQITDRRREFKHLLGKRFVVVDRVPEDRSSGLTEVMFEGGSSYTFLWSCGDPTVKPLGTGRVEIKIIFECDTDSSGG